MKTNAPVPQMKSIAPVPHKNGLAFINLSLIAYIVTDTFSKTMTIGLNAGGASDKVALEFFDHVALEKAANNLNTKLNNFHDDITAMLTSPQ